MIRTPPQYNLKNPPGQVVNPLPQFERPLVEAIADYNHKSAVVTRQEALRASFEEGWRVGYVRGLADSRRAQQQALNPSSEEAR